jgi:putative peptidoglycan lipid II flippase
VIGAVLNYANVFVRPALTSLFFNICMISGLLAGVWFELPSDQMLILLSVVTPAAGAVQFLLMLWMLRSCGKFPIFSRQSFRDLAFVRNLFKNAVPGILGYGMLQLSFLIDRFLALYLGDQAVPALTYVDRMIDLPIGLFAVGMGQVFMARMTASVAAGDLEGLKSDMNYGLRQLFFLSIPLAASVCFFYELMLKVICLGGSYTMADLDAARNVALFYGSGVPFFCALKIIQPAFFARKDMKTPLYCSLTAIGINIMLSVALCRPMAQGGIALATVISSLVNCGLLIFFLKKSGITFGLRNVTVSLVRALLSSAAAGVCVKLLLERFYHGAGRAADFCALCVAGILFGVIYALCSAVSGGKEISELSGRFRK